MKHLVTCNKVVILVGDGADLAIIAIVLFAGLIIAANVVILDDSAEVALPISFLVWPHILTLLQSSPFALLRGSTNMSLTHSPARQQQLLRLLLLFASSACALQAA